MSDTPQQPEQDSSFQQPPAQTPTGDTYYEQNVFGKVQRGEKVFNWYAFFFGYYWAAYKGMWKQWFSNFGLLAVFAGIGEAFNKQWMGAIGIVVAISFGRQANKEYLKAYLERRAAGTQNTKGSVPFGMAGIFCYFVIFGMFSESKHFMDSFKNGLSAKTGFTEAPAIKMVKSGSLESCPSRTLDQLASSFLGSPKWTTGVSEQGVTFVNVSGAMTFADKPVTGLLQFLVAKDQQSFQLQAFEMNEIPQNQLLQASILTKMCEAAMEPSGAQTKAASANSAPAQKQNGESVVDVADIISDYESYQSKTVTVGGFYMSLGEMSFLYMEPGSTIALMVDDRLVAKNQRKKLMKSCGSGCNVSVTGHVGSVMMQKGFIAEEIQIQ